MIDDRCRTTRVQIALAIAALVLRPGLPCQAADRAVVSPAGQQRLVDAPPAGPQVWPSQPPKDCPFQPSKALTGVALHRRP